MNKRVNYSAYPNYVIRVPSLPLESLSALPVNDADLKGFVESKWSDTLVRNAISLASPDLAQGINHAIEEEKDLSLKSCFSFLNYYTRFCTRSTPFGLFAGVSSGRICSTNKIDIQLKSSEEGDLACRLDMEYICNLVNHFTQIKGIREKLRYHTTDSLYSIGPQLRFIAEHYQPGGAKRYTLESVERNEAIDAIIQSAKRGETYFDLVNTVKNVSQESIADCEEFVLAVIQMGLIRHQLIPNLTGEEYDKVLKGNIIELGLEKVFSLFLQQIDLVEKIKKPVDLEIQVPKITKLAERLKIPFNSGKLIQGDYLRKTSENQLPENVSNQVLYGIRILRAMTELDHIDPLREFKTIFRRRYGDNKVLFTDMMDQDVGIGLSGPAFQQQADPSGLLDDLESYGMPGVRPGKMENSNSFALETEMSNKLFLELDKDSLQGLDMQKGEFPLQLNAIVSLVGSKDNPQLVFHAAGEGHPGYILGRFGFLPDEGLATLYSKMAFDEESADTERIYAEIVHLPEERTGNVLQRPSSYSYEIPYLSKSLKPDGQQININSLYVKLEGNRVVLRDSETNKEVVPCLTNAHNYEARQLPLYEFLVKCGKQNRERSFRLDKIKSSNSEFIQGVRMGSMILRLPRWKLKLKPLQTLFAKGDKQLVNEIQKWAKSHMLPDVVLYKQADRSLYIKWSNPVLVIAFWEYAKASKEAHFEFFPYAEESPVKESELNYANELVICFQSEKIG